MKKFYLLIFIVACSFYYQPERSNVASPEKLSGLTNIKVNPVKLLPSARNLILKTNLDGIIEQKLSKSFNITIDKNSCFKTVLNTTIANYKKYENFIDITVFMNLVDCHGNSIWNASYLVKNNDNINNISGATAPMGGENTQIVDIISSLILRLRADYINNMQK